MSGTPVVNDKGELVGICQDDKINMIPSRVLLAISEELLEETIVKLPTFGLEWNKINRELIDLLTKDPVNYGIYIRQTTPDSCCYDYREEVIFYGN